MTEFAICRITIELLVDDAEAVLAGHPLNVGFEVAAGAVVANSCVPPPAAASNAASVPAAIVPVCVSLTNQPGLVTVVLPRIIHRVIADGTVKVAMSLGLALVVIACDLT